MVGSVVAVRDISERRSRDATRFEGPAQDVAAAVAQLERLLPLVDGTAEQHARRTMHLLERALAEIRLTSGKSW